MNEKSKVASTEINSFEEYTIFSLERSVPALLRMMDRSKRIASAWPDPMALVEAVGLTREIAALADYQNTLCAAFGVNTECPADARREQAREKLVCIMDSMEDILNLGDPNIAKRMFAVDLPTALNCFLEAIPLVCGHIREEYMNEMPTPAVAVPGER